MKPIFFTLTFALASAGMSAATPAASESERGQSKEYSIHFKCAHSEIEPAYKENYIALDSLVNTVETLISSGIQPQINITGAASPEGGIDYNYGLSRRRAKAISGYLSNYFSLPDTSISFTYLGRDWQGLKKFVESDRNVPERDEVLRLLNTLTEVNDTLQDRTVRHGQVQGPDGMTALREIGGGKAFSYLFSSYFPTLRATRGGILKPLWPTLTGIDLSEPSLNTYTLTPPPFNTSIFPLNTEAPHRPFYMGIKTNMLSDAALIPSLGIEFYLGKNISVVANWAYAWWDNDPRHYYWRYYGGDLALRWWFGKAAHQKPLTGHHIGVYGGVFTYDFELGGKGYMGGRPGHWLWDRCLANAGIEYGYSLPVARRLNIDFTVGLGYIGGKYIKYHPEGSHYIWDSLNKVSWFGPTKAEVSLVWLIGRGNVNQKGGAR